MGFTVAANSPSLGRIAWADAHIVYEGVDYPIDNGNTDKKFVYWLKAAPTAFADSDTYPSISQDDCIVFLNKGGVPISVLTASATDGDIISPGTVTSVAIATDAIDATHIKTDAIEARHVLAGSITAEKLTVNELSAISANMGTMTAGNFTLAAGGFVRGGASTFNSGTGVWMGNDGGIYKFRAGVPGSSRMEWNGSSFNIYDASNQLTISSGVVDYTKIAGKPGALADISSTEGTKLAGISTGATRNVYRGDWGAGNSYEVGDTVIFQGGGWSSKILHTSAGGNQPPASGTSNTWWTAAAVKGNDGITILIPNDSHTIPASSTGIVSAGSYADSGTTIQVFEGGNPLSAVSSISANEQFTIGAPTQSPASTLTVGTRSYASTTATVGPHSAMVGGTDLVVITYPITVRRKDGTTLNLSAFQTITKSKAGSDGLPGANAKLVYLSASSMVFQVPKIGGATPASTVLTATGQNLTGSPTFTVTSGTATLTGTGNTRTLTYANLTSDSATITVTWDGMTDTITIVKVREGLDGDDGINGLPGANAKAAFVSATSQVFQVNKAGSPSVASITLTATGQNVTGSPAFSVTSGTATLTGTGSTRTLTYANMSSDSITVTMTWDGLTDTVTIAKVREGSDAITINVSNDAHILTASSAGVVSDYTGSGTQITVLEGGNPLTASSTATTSAFRIGTITQSPASTITVGSVGYLSQTATINAHSAMSNSVDSVTLTIPVTVYRADGTSSTFNRVQTLSKSKAGAAGSNGLPGLNGTRTAVLELYRWSASVPTTFPSGDSTYQWSNGQFSNPPTLNNWTATPGAPVAGETLWVLRQMFADTGTSSTSLVTWTANTPRSLAAAGDDGAPGANGRRTAVLELYRWSASAPTSFPVGSSIYQWSNGTFSEPSTNKNNWELVPGAPVTGQTLWGCSVTYSDTDTTVSSSVTWNTAVAYALGAAGSNGAQGIQGVPGATAKAAFISASSQVFRIDQALDATPTSITLSATGQNVTGSPTFSITSGTATLTGSGNTRSLAYSSMTTESVVVQVTWDGITDTITIVKVREGQNGDEGLGALTTVFSNEAHVLTASSTGVVSDYTGSGFTVDVFEGSTPLNASSVLTNSAFRIGTITQNPPSTITVAAPTYLGTRATVAAHSGMANGTNSVTLTVPITVYRADGSSSTFNKVQTIAKSSAGLGALTVIMPNDSHTVPASTDGAVLSYVGSGTTIQVFEGSTPLSAVASLSAASQFTIGTPTQNPLTTLTVGGRSYASQTATVADHSAMSNSVDSVLITYPITVRRANGTDTTINAVQTITKSKAGVDGPQGPSVLVTSDRASTFTATDGTLDAAQANIVFTAQVSGVTSPTYAWTFSGLQTNPTASTTASQTITAAQFGTAKSAIVTCTVNGIYVDKVTIVRLEKSTAEAGATVGADWATNIDGKPSDDALLNERARANPNLVRSLKTWTHTGGNSLLSLTGDTEDGNVLLIPSASELAASSSPLMNLSAATTWVVSFVAWSTAPRTLYVDLFPDTLPESNVVLTTEYRKQYSFVWSSSHANRSSCSLRFFGGTENADIRIGEVKLEAASTRTIWTPNVADDVSVNNPVTASNISTYIADVAIGSAQIANLAVTSAKITDAAVSTLKIEGSAITAATQAVMTIASGTGTSRDSNVVSCSAPANTAVTVLVLVTGRTGITSGALTNLRNPILLSGDSAGALTERYNPGDSFWYGDYVSMTVVDTIAAGSTKYYAMRLQNPGGTTCNLTCQINFFAAKR